MRWRLTALLLVTYSLYLRVTFASATEYQQCTTFSPCPIGEFLYNDDYTALTGASCTLTAKYPDGGAFVSSAAMTGRADGWYSYEAAIDGIKGVYSATICCTPASGLMCLDKSFEVKDPPPAPFTPDQIWAFPTRTLTSYGTLVNDIWSFGNRTISNVGRVVEDIWGHSTRTLTGFGTLVADIIGTTTETDEDGTPVTITSIVSEQTEQRVLLEKLVNTPVVSLSLDEGISIPDLEVKLDESKKHAGALYDNISAGKSRLMILDSKWDRLDASSAQKEIAAVSSLFQDSKALTSLTKSWNTKAVTTLNEESKALQDTLASLLTTTSLTKTKIPPSGLLASLTHLQNLENVLGDTTNSSGDQTLFGYLASVSERNSTLESENQKISAVLENLNGQGLSGAQKEVNNLKSRLLALNQYPGGSSLANPAKNSPDPKLNLKNMLFSLQALVGLNRQILAMNVGDPIRSLWLEEGSVIFRAIITNPSEIISQSVPLKFYLPRELKTEDIIELDSDLTTTYDSTEEALYASGTFELEPGESRLVYVEVEDIWQITEAELETLRTQASDLIKPLDKTAYFSQGTTLKSDIDVTLDKVALITSKAVTPENRIRAYREAQLELNKVGVNMNRLQDLVAQASGTGSLFGFVGGVQTIAVWGMIIVIVGGFIFLSLYFKKLNLIPAAVQADPSLLATSLPPEPSLPSLTPLSSSLTDGHAPRWKTPALIGLVMILTAGSTVLLTNLARPKAPAVVNEVKSSPTPSPSPSQKPVRNDISVESEKDVLGESAPTHKLVVPEDSSVNIRSLPSVESDIVMTIKVTTEVYVFGEDDDWRRIGFSEADEAKEYWVNAKFILPKN